MSISLDVLEHHHKIAQDKMTEQLELASDRLDKVLDMREGIGEFNLHNHNEWIRQAQVKLSNARSYMAQARALKDAMGKVKHAEEKLNHD